MVTAHKTYQLKGHLSGKGHARLDLVLTECAKLYNAAVQERRDAYKMAGESRTFYDQCKEFTSIRQSDPFWGSVSLQVGRGVLRRADRAFQSFFRRAKSGGKPGYPRFKSSRRWHTIELAEVAASMVKGDRIRIVGLPLIQLKHNRELPDSGQLKGLRITKRGRRVVVNLTYAVEIAALPVSTEAVGLDMGVSSRIALSNGESIERRGFPWLDIQEKQRRLARCKKGSREWQKRSRILANAHSKERVRN